MVVYIDNIRKEDNKMETKAKKSKKLILIVSSIVIVLLLAIVVPAVKAGFSEKKNKEV